MKKDYMTKIYAIESANVDVYIITIEQEGKNKRDAEDRARKNAIDKAVELLLKSKYELFTYNKTKDKIYELKDVIIDSKEYDVENRQNTVKFSFALSKSKLKENLTKLGVMRKTIYYRNNRFTPHLLVKLKEGKCNEDEILFTKDSIRTMTAKIGAKAVFPEPSDYEIQEIEKELAELINSNEKFYECVLYECDLVLELYTECDKRFYAEFMFMEPFTSYTIAKHSISVEFSSTLTSADAIDEGIYRMFDFIADRYPKYMETLEGFNKIILIKVPQPTYIDLINQKLDELNKKLDEHNIKTLNTVINEDSVLMITTSQSETDEIIFTLQYIMNTMGLNVSSGFRNRKFMSLYLSDL